MAQRKDDHEISSDDWVKITGRNAAIIDRLLRAIKKNGGSPKDLLKVLDLDPTYANACVAPLIAKCSEPTPPCKTVKIPNKSVAWLLNWIRTECAEQGISSEFLNQNLKKWKKLLAEARGKEFEVITHKFTGNWCRRDAERIHDKQRCDGDSAAFIFWALTERPEYWSTTMPNDDARLFRDLGFWFALRFCWFESNSELDLRHVGIEWNDGYVLVAFRMIAPSEPVASK